MRQADALLSNEAFHCAITRRAGRQIDRQWHGKVISWTAGGVKKWCMERSSQRHRQRSQDFSEDKPL